MGQFASARIQVGLSAFYRAILVLSPCLAMADEPVEVWLTPPSILNAREIGERITASSNAGLDAARKRWDAHRATRVSYILDQFTTGILFTNCDMEPVAVRVAREKIESATYATGTAKCKKGSTAREPQYSQKILTPEQIFRVAIDSIAANPECGVKVEYDDRTGLPTLIEGGCWFEIDSYWAIKVSDLKILDAR